MTSPSEEELAEPKQCARLLEGGQQADVQPSAACTVNKREFIRLEIVADNGISDQHIQEKWRSLGKNDDLQIGVIRRERTLFDKARSFDQRQGLVDFFDSQAQLLLSQFQNIEQLLGPPDSDWSWPGEHCETLLRSVIANHLPPGISIGKGYMLGTRATPYGPRRSPEIDILVFDENIFPPIFRMGHFVIVRPESVVAAIQVKRSLDASTLANATENVVAAKRHVAETCRFEGDSILNKMFSAVVCFKDQLSEPGAASISASYKTSLGRHVSEWNDYRFLPNFVGSLEGVFLFTGYSPNDIIYICLPSKDKDKNIALPFLLYQISLKVRPSGLELPLAMPPQTRVIDTLHLWRDGTKA